MMRVCVCGLNFFHISLDPKKYSFEYVCQIAVMW